MSDFIIRHYNPETDLSSLSRVLTEIESIDRDGEETSEEFLRSMTEWRNFDPDQNVWIAELDEAFVGYGQILPRPGSHASLYIVVQPSQRRKGLGTQLLSLTLARARATECKNLLVYANGHNLASLAFLAHHGFDVAGTSGVMVASVSDLPRVELPAGYSARRYLELGDPKLVAQALDQCYKDQVGHHQNVTDAEPYLKHYGAQGIHLLFDEKQNLIGICAGKPEGKADQSSGEISDLMDAPGVVREFRQRGYQRFLALTVMHWLREQGTRRFTLEYWGDDEKAIAIYRELGFELVSELLTYHKMLV